MKKMKKTMMFVALFVVTIAVHAQSLNGKTFKIQSAAPNSKGKVIDADGYTLGKNGTKIQLWDMNGASHQNWQFQFAGRGANNYYIISMSPRAGKFNFLEASGGHLANNGGIVQLWENNLGGKNQLWKVTKNSDGNYRIVTTEPNGKGASLDADGYTQGKNGGKVQLWQPLNNANQAWKLIPLESKKITITGPKTITPKTPKPYSSWVENTLMAGETLKAGQTLIVSGNGKYILKLQASDGNLCVYKYNNQNNKTGNFVWGSMKYGFKNAKLIMQKDGNLVVYDAQNKPRWSSKTHVVYDAKFRNPKNRPDRLVLENDGKLNLYTKSNEIVWTSK